MYESISTRAIVLKKRPYLERDSFVDLFCEQIGRISIFVKSLRDIKNKFNGKLESFSQIHLVLENRNNKFIIKDIKVEKYLNTITIETSKFAIASAIAEMTILFTAEQQIIDGYFELLQESFDLLLIINNKEELIKIAFYIKALTIMGFLNTEKTCHFCKAKIANNFMVEKSSSAMHCITCYKNTKNNFGFLKFHFHSLKLFNFLQIGTWHAINKISIANKSIIHETENLIQHFNYLREYRHLKSECFWQDIQTLKLVNV